MTPRGYLAMERFQDSGGFLGMIRFDDLWVWVGLMALVLLRLPLQICLSHSLMAERNVKRVMVAYTVITSMPILAAAVICADNYPN
ncbi:MAG: hypothetical protein IKH30_16485 [Clostridia bacterium]|nr:hypothetical protein [Clostridia bacterium]